MPLFLASDLLFPPSVSLNGRTGITFEIVADQAPAFFGISLDSPEAVLTYSREHGSHVVDGSTDTRRTRRRLRSANVRLPTPLNKGAYTLTSSISSSVLVCFSQCCKTSSTSHALIGIRIRDDGLECQSGSADSSSYLAACSNPLHLRLKSVIDVYAQTRQQRYAK